MHRPPEPRYNFTIPSIHDDTTLDCRLYHPAFLPPSADNVADPSLRRKRGIVMAHPYAPLGGNYDDRVVNIVVDHFLEAGWIVGTFNFRGAQGSKGRVGRTSWTGRPEVDDYNSFAAFFIHYIGYLQTPEQLQSPSISTSPDSDSLHFQQSGANSVVILGGYSYGSLILQHMPPVPTILQPFIMPVLGSTTDEILLRARKLANQSNQEWVSLARAEERERRTRRTGHDHKPSVTMGGDETSPDKRRSSRDIRRSNDGTNSLKLRTRLRSLSHRRRDEDDLRTPSQSLDMVDMTMPDIRYLLISPLAPPVSTLAAPALVHKFWNRSKDAGRVDMGKHFSLAVYGDHDGFTSAKRLRVWSEQMKHEPGSRFSSVQIAGAGHFWVEVGVEETLKATLSDWEADVR